MAAPAMRTVPPTIPPKTQPPQKACDCLTDLTTKISDFVQSRWGIVIGIGVAITLTMGLVYGALAAGVAALAAVYLYPEENSKSASATRTSAAKPQVFSPEELEEAMKNFRAKMGAEPKNEADLREKFRALKTDYGNNPKEFAMLCQAIQIQAEKQRNTPEFAHYASAGILGHLKNQSLQLFDALRDEILKLM